MARQFRPKEEKVADFLRESIISGRFARGERLKQQEIADRLKTSITPVREALKLLEAEGYVTADNYRGATVAPSSTVMRACARLPCTVDGSPEILIGAANVPGPSKRTWFIASVLAT